VGGIADLLVVQGNPFDDGECLWSPCAERTVLQAGRVVHRGRAAQAV
jgi:hypothetical protein